MWRKFENGTEGHKRRLEHNERYTMFLWEKIKIRIIKASFQSKVTTRFKVPPIKLTKGSFCFCFYMCLLKNKGKLARKILKK